jgi:hypothetical protein
VSCRRLRRRPGEQIDWTEFTIAANWPAARREQLFEALRTGRVRRPEEIAP